MSARVRRVAGTTVPVALLLYAACRWLDGRDHHHGPGLWWDLGHAAFLMSWLGFAVLAVVMARTSRPAAPARGAGLATLAGIAAFAWVTLTDLFPGLPDLPDPLRPVGPLLFLGGLVTLLAVTARAQQHRRWWVFPLLALAATLTVSANLDLLPVAAVLFGAALLPAAGPRRQSAAGASAPANERSASGATR